MESNTPKLVESLKSTDGKRSVTRAVFPPGAKAIEHYHTQYRETFHVLKGTLFVFHSGKEQYVRASEFSDTIDFREVHYYENLSSQNVEVEIILEPGHAGSEMTNLIIAGLERDEKLNLLSAFGGYNSTWLALYEITNTIPVGVPGLIFSLMRFWMGKNKIERVKRELIGLAHP